ncbi:MAG: hypothetical protein AAB496_00540 [Patescibacteria group bacterium]
MEIEGGFEQLNSAEMLCHQLQIEMAGDPHWGDIDCHKIEEQDALLLQKFMGGELMEEDLNKRIEELEESGKCDPGDSSCALAALLRNKIIVKKYRKEKGGFA